ncbi:ATP-binding protein [Candidatus Bathyarchaeota archaeon]|nr:ATP-binding protein [Candidatus Bathyarchaeota archaeon]
MKVKQITVLSGKGGAGKTTLTASLVSLTGNCVTTDCDVDASNLHLLLNPEVIDKREFYGQKKAEIDPSKCIKCRLCEESCRFDAIRDFQVDPILCEGCGVCVHICPTEAITLRENVSGYLYTSRTKYGFMCHAQLKPGEENSGKLVNLVRRKAKDLAEKWGLSLIINDGPPGIGCPTIASVTGVDLGIVVTEPTLSGIHDLKRALTLLGHFGIKPLVCINKYDLNLRNTEDICRFCLDNGIEVVGKIKFDPIVTESMVAGKPIVEYSPSSPVSKSISEVWARVMEELT